MKNLVIKLSEEFIDIESFFEKFDIPLVQRANYGVIFTKKYETFQEIKDEILENKAFGLMIPKNKSVYRQKMPIKITSWPIHYYNEEIGNIFFLE